jgi:hypothetical protein
MPAQSGSAGATPAGYTALTTYAGVVNAAFTYDSAASPSPATVALNGSYAVCVLGVDNTYTGGAGTNQATPSLTFTYDEA